jgi:hypothetical protein
VLPESLEWWKSAFEIGGVALLLLTFFAGFGALWFSRQLNAVQAEKLRQFDSGLTDAKTKLGEQQERAAKADARVAGLEKDASDAKTELGKQQERTADAELRLLELQESISWRNPDRALIPQLVPPLQIFANQRYVIISDVTNVEENNVTSWLVILLGTSNWRLETAQSASELRFPATNIVLWVSPTAPDSVLAAARALVPALEAARLPALVLQIPWGPPPDAAPPELIRVVVFKRGPRMTVEGNRISFQDSPVQFFFGAGPPQ